MLASLIIREVYNLCYIFAEQFLIYNIGLVPSKFYKVLGSKDSPGFWRETGLAVVLIVSEAFVSRIKI